MKLNKINFLKENIKDLYGSGNVYVGLVFAFLPAILITIFIIKNPESPFYIKHVSNFYAMFGILMAVISANRVINRDFSQNTISLFFNQSSNRTNYIFSNSIYAFVVAVIYGLNGILLLLVASKLGVPGELGLDFYLIFIANIILTVLFYFLLSLTMFLYRMKSGFIFGVLVGLILFLPNILNTILTHSTNDSLIQMIENFPFYFLPVFVASNAMSYLQYGIAIVGIILLYIVTLKKSKIYSF